MGHLLVTNDFPPQVGGIESYLWELWKRLPEQSTTVLTHAYPGAKNFDADAPFRIVRTRTPVLLPEPVLARRIKRLVSETGSDFVVFDPALPLGALGPQLGIPYAVVLHGAEVAVPGRLPGLRSLLGRVLRNASLIIAAGSYPAAEGRRAARLGDTPPVVEIPPGVDVKRFVPLMALERASQRARLGLPAGAPLVVSVSRLVPRKGMDTLIAASTLLSPRYPDLHVVIAGSGHDRARLERQVEHTGAPVKLLGRVADADLPAVYACADLFVLCCRNRWAGLEQEGFGLVFLEAAAAGVPSVAGRSGGAADAVVHGETGLIVERPRDPKALAAAMTELLDDPDRAAAQGRAARLRAERDLSWDVVGEHLRKALLGVTSGI
ncbi:MAG: glycosyltransferase family 4 protein [Acidimicrobiales bacterium]